MGFFASLLGGPVISFFVDKLMGPAEDLFKAYFDAKITKEQLAEKLQETVQATFAQVEVAFAESLTKTYTAFIQAAGQNPVMARAWSIVVYSQLFVLVWHQLVIPALATYGIQYKSSGATVDWAYALIALCLGAPAIASRVGPAAGWAGDSLKKLIGK